MTRNNTKLRTRDRITIVVLALAVLAMGLSAMAHRNFSYENWWGGLVFAPIAVIAGALFTLAPIFKPDFFKKKADR